MPIQVFTQFNIKNSFTTKKYNPMNQDKIENLKVQSDIMGYKKGADVDIKECIDCKRCLTLDKFRMRQQRGKPYVIAKCRECEREYNRIHHCKEKKKISERKRLSNPDNKRRKNEYQISWRKKNISKNRAYHRKNIKKNVDELSDLYISRTMCRGMKNIPEDLIEVKRTQLKLKRLIKQK